jgi:hypothetical protein
MKKLWLLKNHSTSKKWHRQKSFLDEFSTKKLLALKTLIYQTKKRVA